MSALLIKMFIRDSLELILLLVCLSSMVGEDDEDAVSDSELNEPVTADVLAKK